MKILEAANLHKHFGNVRAVDGVSFSIEAGQTLGVMGASGSGKSTLAKLILGLMTPDGGMIHRHYQGRAHAVFQHPAQSLNPKMTVRDALEEPYRIQGRKGPLEAIVRELMEEVELPAPYLERKPSQLSGGECQRVAIARAISLTPSLIVCDEAVSSLDALTQAGILNLLLRVQKEKRTAFLFISHDPAVIRHMSDAVLVMESGKGYNSFFPV